MRNYVALEVQSWKILDSNQFFNDDDADDTHKTWRQMRKACLFQSDFSFSFPFHFSSDHCEISPHLCPFIQRLLADQSIAFKEINI